MEKIKISFYLSGSVKDSDWTKPHYRRANNAWRLALEETINEVFKNEEPNCEPIVNFPEGVGCDHGGLQANSTILVQAKQIKESNIFVAYFDREDLTGSLCELWEAIYYDKPILIFLNQEKLGKNIESLDTAHNYGTEFYSQTTQTNHFCPCQEDSGWTIPIANNHLWYTLYLIQIIHSRTILNKYKNEKKQSPLKDKIIKEHEKIINAYEGNVYDLPNLKINDLQIIEVQDEHFDSLEIRTQLRIFSQLGLLYREYRENKQPNNLFTQKINSLAAKLYDEEKEYFLINKLIQHNPEKYSKDILYQFGMKEKKIDSSKTLYEAIDRGAILEGIEITNYMREQLAQKMVEIIQDSFKDYKEKWKLKKVEDTNVVAFIENHFVRQREYQRWSDDELKNLWHLWKYECKRIPDIARLMQRTPYACEKMIDFIEKYGQKYQNLDNHYKRIITKAGVMS